MFSLLVLALGCNTEPPPPPEPEKPACELGLDAEHLKDKTFVRFNDGDPEPDVMARAHFFMEGDTLKVKYNTRALTDMYTYTCKKEAKEIVCLADHPDLYQWCLTLFANKGSCAPGELASYTGASVADAQKASEKAAADMKKASPDVIARTKSAYSQPNNQLRGVLHVKFAADACRLTMRDTYQTMERAQVEEFENIVGSARFVPTDQDLVFEHCKDFANFVALATPDAKPKPGESKVEWKPGDQVTFRYVGPDLAKAEPNCKYSMDFYSHYAPVKKGEEVSPDAAGNLTWTANQTFTEKGKDVVHLYRYKDCGQGPQLASVSCQWVNIKE
jgi:hypothetical protein